MSSDGAPRAKEIVAMPGRIGDRVAAPGSTRGPAPAGPPDRPVLAGAEPRPSGPRRRRRALRGRLGGVLGADGGQLPVPSPALRGPDAQAAAPRGDRRLCG